MHLEKHYNEFRRNTPETHKVIAIDLDGTIWEDRAYPGFGKVFDFAIQVINGMVMDGYHVVIWTCRGGDNLQLCKEELFRLGLNQSIQFNEHATYYTSKYPIQSLKIAASLYLDNSAFGSPDYKNLWFELGTLFLSFETLVKCGLYIL